MEEQLKQLIAEWKDKAERLEADRRQDLKEGLLSLDPVPVRKGATAAALKSCADRLIDLLGSAEGTPGPRRIKCSSCETVSHKETGVKCPACGGVCFEAAQTASG